MSNFNLLDEAWIPVMPVNGNEEIDVSMKDLFRNAHRYKTISGDTATQNFAVMRVLLAVIQTVFSRFGADGNPNPNIRLDEKMRQTETVDEDDWEYQKDFLEETWNQLWRKGQLPDIVLDYLEVWRDRFYLLDEKHPFFQVNESEVRELFSEKNSEAILQGNTHGKFMNRLLSESEHKRAMFSPVLDADNTARDKMTSAELARWLITFQAYTGLSDKKTLVGDGQKPSRGWLFDLGGLYLQGRNVFETLLLNFIPVHSSDEALLSAAQKPCWEFSGIDFVRRIVNAERIDNLAELYTNWSRVIYLDSEYESGEPVCVGIAKLPAIPHQDIFLEPMTIWRSMTNGDNKGHFMPQKHRPEQAIWRSFGLITLKNTEGQHRPEILNQFDRVRRTEGSRWIRMIAAGMQDDGNATSWVPVDEISDQLSLNDIIVTDQEDDGWVVRINDEVQKTKDVIETIYKSFLKDLESIRDAKNTNFVAANIEDAYMSIDAPFRKWLEQLKPDDWKEDKMMEWNRELKRIMTRKAYEFIESAGDRDFRGIEREGGILNIATAMNRYLGKLNKLLG